MDELVGLPKITFTIGAVAPIALPNEVLAKAETATAKNNERRVSGFWAQ
jgi:hypothetical protein